MIILQYHIYKSNAESLLYCYSIPNECGIRYAESSKFKFKCINTRLCKDQIHHKTIDTINDPLHKGCTADELS